MSEHGPRSPRAGADRFFEAIESLGLVVLLASLPVSEAAKSAGLFLATLGFVGRRLSGSPFPEWRRAPTVALAAFYLIAAASMLVQAPDARRPESLFSLATTLVAFPIALDACARRGRRVLFIGAILVGGAAAAVLGHADYMSDRWLRLVLPSIENAVPAAEYLGAVAALVLTGVPGQGELKAVLSRLESKQQALIFGHGVPMPIVVRTREYGSAESYKSFGFRETAELKAQMERDVDDLWGPRSE